jgi:hypothetical protein
MEKHTVKIAPLSGYVFYEDDEFVARLPRSEKEEREIEECHLDSFFDNPRFQLFGITKDILALEYAHAREWDRKNLNLIGNYEKKTGALASILRYSNGDKSELDPLPEAYAKNPGILRIKAMNEKLM